jgi:hypothetical protein
LTAITEPRLYGTERGYQGELLAQLRPRLRDELWLPGNPIVEQEYQKRAADHGVTIRPDLIVHVPFERRKTRSRRHGNFVAIEIKFRATAKAAEEDFGRLRLMKEKLGYPLTIFLNIDSDRPFSDLCPASIAKQTYCFAVKLKGNAVLVSESACA